MIDTGWEQWNDEEGPDGWLNRTESNIESNIEQKRNTQIDQMADSHSPPSDSTQARGWGTWRTSAFSVFSDLQKAATQAADEITHNGAS